MKTIRHLLRGLAFLSAVALARAVSPQEAIIADITQARNETVLTHNELGASLVALIALTEQTEGDLRPTFATFQAGLPRTRLAKERTVGRVAQLIAAGQKHFASWQADIDTITDHDIRRHALARREATQKRWNEAVSALQQAVQQFEPLLVYLHDIDTALSYDLTVKGVRSVRGATDSAAESFQGVQRHVARAVAELEKMTQELGSVIPA